MEIYETERRLNSPFKRSDYCGPVENDDTLGAQIPYNEQYIQVRRSDVTRDAAQ